MYSVLGIILLLLSSSAHAHVKWFSDFAFEHPPLTLSELNHPTFWFLFGLCIVVIPLIVFADKWMQKSPFFKGIDSYLEGYADQSVVIMRVAMAAVFLMSWQGDSIIAPEIPIPSPLWGWLQFFMAILLLFRQTTFISGIGMLVFYFIGIANHGFFHMLDYIVYPAVGIFLIVSYSKNLKIKNIDLPILYCGLGFSLCWVAFEKMIYPYWGLSILSEVPQLAMGLPHDFFLLSAAFIEFALGYLLIICLLQRPLAVIVTLVFFTTTIFFGKTEVVGHTILHGALLVFIMRGPGHYYQAPIRFHKKTGMRALFAAVNFIILFALLIIPYDKMAQKVYAKHSDMKESGGHGRFVLESSPTNPSIRIEAYKDTTSGWNFHLVTENFTFTPENIHHGDVPGTGHAHVYINGKKWGRIYSNWFHLTLAKGQNRIKVSLNSNTHLDYYIEQRQVSDEVMVLEERDIVLDHAH